MVSILGGKFVIGIIGAMELEVQEIRSEMKNIHTTSILGIDYDQGTIENVPCVLARCGVGKVAAAACAQTMLLKYHPQLVINVGVAGGIGEGIQIGDLVIAQKLVQHDMDTTAAGDPPGFLSGPNLIYLETAEKVLETAVSVSSQFYPSPVHCGIIATGDQFVADGELRKKICRQFDAVACEMEGGAIAQICWNGKTDFLVLRAISDSADQKAVMAFPMFARMAANRMFQLLPKLLPALEGLYHS
jgi:adenosylhomocysteine nucleosidase